MNTKKEIGNWLSKFVWTYFVTFTFSLPVTITSAIHQLVRFLKAMFTIKAWFWITEKGQCNGRHHSHALIRADSKLSEAVLKKAWKRGLVDVQRYDPDLGAAFYITKALDDDSDYCWDFHLPDDEMVDPMNQG